VQKCGDQRLTPRFVFNELSHFLIVDSWRSCWIARPVASLLGHTPPVCALSVSTWCGHTSAPAPVFRAHTNIIRLFQDILLIAYWYEFVEQFWASRKSGLGSEECWSIKSDSRTHKRHIVVFRFYCDLSYDGSPDTAVLPSGTKHEPRTYVVGGFFASQPIWNIVEAEWGKTNSAFRVPRYHAAHLNAKSHEYAGWDDHKKICYSKELLKIVNGQGKKLHAITCGILANEYRTTINQKGRINLGSPYLACFKSCIALIAREMCENFPPGEKFEVFLDTDDGYLEALTVFNRMKDDATFPHRSKLATCTPGKMEEIIPLQSADMVAYEVFKRLHGLKNTKSRMRPVLSLLYENNVVSERYFGAKTLRTLKFGIESAVCYPGGLVISPSS